MKEKVFVLAFRVYNFPFPGAPLHPASAVKNEFT